MLSFIVYAVNKDVVVYSTRCRQGCYHSYYTLFANDVVIYSTRCFTLFALIFSFIAYAVHKVVVIRSIRYLH